ncbi:MAG TPA: hypothetical protein VMK53_10740 [Gemmatimonadales bacterium]|nr:hypothetical protein [Gemmatimonadales bacterium]
MARFRAAVSLLLFPAMLGSLAPAAASAQEALTVTRVRPQEVSVELSQPSAVMVLGITIEGAVRLLHQSEGVLPAGASRLRLTHRGPWIFGEPSYTVVHSTASAPGACLLTNPGQYWTTSPAARYSVGQFICSAPRPVTTSRLVSRSEPVRLVVLAVPVEASDLSTLLEAVGEDALTGSERDVRDQVTLALASTPATSDWTAVVRQAARSHRPLFTMTGLEGADLFDHRIQDIFRWGRR